MSRIHDWAHDKRSRVIRARAYADPATRCWRCGLTLAEVRAANPDRKVVWHAGHTGGPFEPVMAECSLCNWRDSAQTTTAKRARASSGGTGRF